MYDFLTDLDEFFCEKYANYDKLCVLPGYKMPVMQGTRIDEYGRTYAYTLPSNTMRLSTQEKKAEILAELKNRLSDITFSFAFVPLGFWGSLKNRFSAYGFARIFKEILKKYALDEESGREGLTVDKEIWRGILKGAYFPSKNLLLSFALTAQLSADDTLMLLRLCGEELDFTQPKDVVLCYLLQSKVYDRGMIDAALAEYKISNLFLA